MVTVKKLIFHGTSSVAILIEILLYKVFLSKINSTGLPLQTPNE